MSVASSSRAFALASVVAAASPVVAQTAHRPLLQYPRTATVDEVDDYFGTRVADPYRWLERTDSPEAREWIAQQNALTFAYLDALPGRDAIKKRLTALWNYRRASVPERRGSLYIWQENSGLQNQSVLYARRGRDGRQVAILDPNTLSTNGTVALSGYDVSRDERYLAYAVSAAGSDWEEIRVRDLRAGRDLADTVRWVKFSNVAWTHDGRGFFYSRFAAPTAGDALLAANRGQKLYYHRLGQPQSEDELIWERPDEPDWLVSAEVTDDGHYAVLTVSEGTDPRNRLYFIDLDKPGKPRVTNPIVKLLDDFDASYRFVGNRRTVFYFLTDLDAPNGRVIAIDIDAPLRESWRTIIRSGPDKLDDVALAGDRLVANYLHDAHARLAVYSRMGTSLGAIPLPSLGAVTALSGRPDDDELFFGFTSYLQPTSVYRYDVKRGALGSYFVPTVGFDASRYVTEQVFYQSKDGTRVPMFITHRKGLALDGKNPTLLYAYGGFDISMTPVFQAQRIVWLELGGVYAVANLRGGGEYGEAWHQAGMHEKKQNVFDDFIAAAEYLEHSGWTSRERLAIQGGSNGGLLIGAVMTQRPELFGVALPAVGVMDMLRFQKFTIGRAWVPEYGSSDDPTQFQYLARYSPLHNIHPGTSYPATLVTTSDHDDRVVPGHSFKFAATLQAAQAGPAPVLIRIETDAGHGAGKPTSKQIDVATDEMAFALANMGVNPPGATP